MSVAPGFARHEGSGLYVPEEHKRARETWTYDEWRVLERATKLLDARGVRMYLKCDETGCEAPMERIRNLDGGITLRCGHKDRAVVRFRRG